ncbi:MAG: PorV/PorQ family protein [Bacteriovoracaceae bacterium]|nr:PorV/PorQ family protein [Bacteroidota bacterium]
MKILIIHIAIILLLTIQQSTAQLLPVLGAQRAGTSTVQFLKIGVGARAAGMGESFVALANDASALYWNPAGITQFSENQLLVSHANWLVDINHQFLGAVYHLSTDDAVGLSITSLHMDDMPVTTEIQPFGNGEYFRFADIAIGFTYGRKLTEQFSFGATVRYIEETLDMLTTQGVLIDLGTYYWTGLGTSRFSAVITNFGSQVKPTGTVKMLNGNTTSDFEEYTPPTLFRFGFAFDPINDDLNTLTTSIQLNHPNDNSENIGLGVEYQWMKTFVLRGGYKLNVDEQRFSFGGGINASLGFVDLSMDYGFVSFTNLGDVHRISLIAKL